MRKKRKEWADNVSFKNDESATSRVKTKSVLFQDSVPNSGLAVRNFLKLKDLMKKILYLGNTLNQGTARGLSFCWIHGPGLAEFMHSDDLFKLTTYLKGDSNSSMALLNRKSYLAEYFTGIQLDDEHSRQTEWRQIGWTATQQN
ncbi:hypothetical protein PVK06_015666 [Gossypium arboreum]|uniref:FH2 domain-containing protein n=1 Tax=Gossypium arboreum TaxID=29729 RepID=A0ABR0PY03_GOSAR|nr:hypothetical protein PVK06_015666 [Gossypium arboreum]